MLQYILKRILLMIPTILVISFVAFIIIDLPPSDYAETYVATLAANGNVTSQETLDQLRNLYGLGEPAPERYVKWMWGISYTHLRAHETRHDLVCRLLLEKK